MGVSLGNSIYILTIVYDINDKAFINQKVVMNPSFDYYQYKSTCFLAFQGDLEF
jgi:hypothetical protein